MDPCCSQNGGACQATSWRHVEGRFSQHCHPCNRIDPPGGCSIDPQLFPERCTLSEVPTHDDKHQATWQILRHISYL